MAAIAPYIPAECMVCSTGGMIGSDISAVP